MRSIPKQDPLVRAGNWSRASSPCCGLTVRYGPCAATIGKPYDFTEQDRGNDADDNPITVTIPGQHGRKLATQTKANLAASDEQIAQGFVDDDMLFIQVKGTVGSDTLNEGMVVRFGDLPTSDMRILLGVGGYNQAVLLKRSGAALQGRRGGGVTAVTVTVLPLPPWAG